MSQDNPPATKSLFARSTSLSSRVDTAESKPLEEQLSESLVTLWWFGFLPKRNSNKRVTIEFTFEPLLRRTSIAECEALNLTIGDTVSGYFEINPGGSGYNIYAGGEVGEQLLKLKEGEQVLARARTAFGEGWKVESVDCDEFRVRETHEGLVIIKLLQGTPSQSPQQPGHTNDGESGVGVAPA
jgi:hypothetical protein